VGLAPGEPRPRRVDRVPGVGHQNDVARIHEGERDVAGTLLGPDEGEDLRARVKGHSEAAVVPLGGGPAKGEQPFVVWVAVVLRLARRSPQRLHDVRRGREVRIPDPEIDQVDAAGPRLLLLAVNLGEEVGRQTLQAIGQRETKAHEWRFLPIPGQRPRTSCME